jgi:hypothetical protein
MRLWVWLDRPVSDAEARRWLRNAPVDLSIYSAIQPIYVARPIFNPRRLDPVPHRFGVLLQPGSDTIAVPDLRASPPTPAPRRRPPTTAAPDRAIRYLQGVINNVLNAPDGQRHAALKSAAPVAFSLVELGLLDEGDAWAQLNAAAAACGWPQRRSDRLLAWARARAAACPLLPTGLD